MSDVAQQYLPEFRLAHRRAIVTGAGSGIGKASALALAASGADVAVTELPERLASAEETVATICAMGRRGVAFPLNVREVPHIQAVMREAAAALGGLDLVVANAGTNVQREALAVTEEDWDAVIDVNLRGVFFTIQFAVQHMLEAREHRQEDTAQTTLSHGGVAEPSRAAGSVVIISSQLGMVGVPGGSRAAYGASKGGVINLVRMLAIEWAPRGIRVNSVAPATTSGTPMNAPLFADPAWRERMLSRIPLGDFITPEDVAAAVVFLASSAARMVTGQTLLVDGGWTAQ
jgi:NAD(P)-dependent dehydrogenase (short-subunit alcohol dehydrogenase family)